MVFYPPDRIVGNSPALVALREQIRHLTAFDAVGNPHVPTLLLEGETGTGKGLVARVTHESGARASSPFIDVNCAAIPEHLLEAELYGFEPGAFTDAKRAKPGLFEAASRGTLFLDEIDALPLPLQGKLLRSIEDKRVRRLGAVSDHAVDVKVVAAAQSSLSRRVAEGRFRSDLYHRLAVVVLTIPPLRERGNDIVDLAQHFLRCYAEAHGVHPKQMTEAAEGWLRAYDWPGNVRELSHLMERLTLLAPEVIVDAHALEHLCFRAPRPVTRPERRVTDGASGSRDEADRIRHAIADTAGNVVQAARLLGLSRNALRYRMVRYGIERPKPSHRSEPEPDLSLPVGASSSSEEPAQGSTVIWEKKPVAVLAIELTFPRSAGLETVLHEPWTLAKRWERLIADKVEGFGGVVLQRAPSLSTVVFGVPRALDQMPQRTLNAGLAVRHLIEDAASSGTPWCPEIRVGVHLGETLVDMRVPFAAGQLLAIGDTLALPVRLLGLAAAGDIVVSSAVRRAVDPWVTLASRALPADDNRNRHEAYVVTGLKPERFPTAGPHHLSRFVGREREMADLRRALGLATEGRGQVVAIVGEAGVGKSRLCFEFVQAARDGCLVLETSSPSHGQPHALLPMIELLRRYCGIGSRDDEATWRQKVRNRACALDPRHEDAVPYLLALLGVSEATSGLQHMDSAVKRRRTFDALKTLLLRESLTRPVVVIVEDLHWFDDETLAFLDTLVEGVPETRLLLVVTYRPEHQHRWGGKSSYVQVRLDPLVPADAEVLVADLVGDVPELQRLVMSKAQGNPFFIEEIVQALGDQGVVVRDPHDKLTLAGARKLPADFELPATIQGVLAARMDRLAAEERTLLQALAVVGQECSLSLVRRVVDQTDEEMQPLLARLQATEFVHERPTLPEPTFVFKHALTHDVAYGSVRPDRRRDLHTRIVEAIETLYADSLVEHVERLAHHALKGRQWEKAARYGRQAGAKCLGRSANYEATACFEQALGALARLPAVRWTQELAVDLRLDLYDSLQPLNQLPRILGYLREAETLARALDDRDRLGWALLHTCHLLLLIGDCREAVEVGHSSLAIGQSIGDGRLQVIALLWLGCGYFALGEHAHAVDLLRQALGVLRTGAEQGRDVTSRFLVMRLPVVIHGYLSLFLAELGQFAESALIGDEAVRLAEGFDHPYSLALVCWMVGGAYSAKGEFERAVALLDRGAGVGREWGYARTAAIAEWRRAYVLAVSGCASEGLDLLKESVEQIDAGTGYTWLRGSRLCHLGEAYLVAGHVDEARAVTEEALAFSGTRKERGFEAWALRLSGEIAAQRHPPDLEAGDGLYRRALALASELEMRPLVAHCHLGLGKLYRRTAKRLEAQEHLATASRMYREMDMRFWLERAEAELKEREL